MKVGGTLPDPGDFSGEVLARICVSTTGEVSSVALMRDRPPLGERVRSRVLGWRYRPLVENGQALPFCHVTRFQFR